MTITKKNPLTLIAGIRFQLDQLNSANSHHEFEHLCRHLARARISENILPATGPVSGGGDQGRDFESFTSFVSRTSAGSKLFFGLGESKPLVFACSLQRTSIEKKIKSDVDDIVAGGKPYIIYFFSNQNVSVAIRHRVQSWCLEKHEIRLEIFDAPAIAELLSSSSTFWIAEEFLRVPSELFPATEGLAGDPYSRARKKWVESGAPPHNYADFVEIKLGLRRATFQDSAKADLKRWIQVMEVFLVSSMPEEMRRRATYEICVASLRGMNNLDSKRELVESYFSNWGLSTDTTVLNDGTVLASYCTTAQLRGEFQMAPKQLHLWTKVLADKVDDQLNRNPNPNRRAELLAVRAHLCQLAYLDGEDPSQDTDETFKYWGQLVTAAKVAPLYPIEEFADVLTQLAPLLEADQRYRTLVERVERLLGDRAKSYVVAEKSRDRAVQLLGAGKTLAAIDQLHRARVRWFTGDTIRGSLLASLTLSEAYAGIGLEFAAKYHAMGAAYLAARSSDEELKRYLPSALHQLGLVQYAAGEWVSLSALFPIFLISHYSHNSEPDEWHNHLDVQAGLMHFLFARSWAKAVGGEAAKVRFESALRESSIPDHMKEEILNPPLPLDRYEAMGSNEIAEAVSKEFWGVPFADCGPVRVYRWRSLGIDWKISCANTFETVPVVEQFVAVLQISIAELARSELCLLPTSVELNVEVGDGVAPKVSNVPDNTNRLLKYLIAS